MTSYGTVQCGKAGFFLNIPHKNFLIRGFSAKVNPLTAGRIDDKAERAALTEENSQLDFLKC